MNLEGYQYTTLWFNDLLNRRRWTAGKKRLLAELSKFLANITLNKTWICWSPSFIKRQGQWQFSGCPIEPTDTVMSGNLDGLGVEAGRSWSCRSPDPNPIDVILFLTPSPCHTLPLTQEFYMWCNYIMRFWNTQQIQLQLIQRHCSWSSRNCAWA